MTETTLNDLDERMKILQMVESGRISASEGATLLHSLGKEQESKKVVTPSGERDPQWFRVRVTDMVTGKRKAIVNIPFGLMDWGLKIGAQFAPELSELDMARLGDALRECQADKIVDVIDDVDGEHVEVYIE
jgi:hypothetical protein